MFRKEVSGRTIAVAMVLILAVVQFFYWRLLVYQPRKNAQIAGGAPAGPMHPTAVGLEDVQVDTLAGDSPGYADGPAWKARFCGPNALALDRDGSLLVSDSRNHRIRRVSAAGAVTTVAGGGPAGGSGGQAEGPAAEARFRCPSGVAVGQDGTVFIADTGNHRLCRLRDGTVSVLAGGAEGAADGAGSQARFHAPAALAVGADGALWVLDAGDLRVRRVDEAGQVTTPAQVPAPVKAALGEAEPAPPRVPVSAWSAPGAEPEATSFLVGRRSGGSSPPGLPQVFADTEHGAVLLQRASGPPLLLAGYLPDAGMTSAATDGTGNRASFALPCAVAVAPDGTVYVAEYESHRIRRLRLPQWLLAGESRTPGRGRGRWRNNWRNRSGS